MYKLRMISSYYYNGIICIKQGKYRFLSIKCKCSATSMPFIDKPVKNTHFLCNAFGLPHFQ